MFQLNMERGHACIHLVYLHVIYDKCYILYVWNLTKIRLSILMELFAYHGLSLYILVTGLSHTRQLVKKLIANDSMCRIVA